MFTSFRILNILVLYEIMYVNYIMRCRKSSLWKHSLLLGEYSPTDEGLVAFRLKGSLPVTSAAIVKMKM